MMGAHSKAVFAPDSPRTRDEISKTCASGYGI